MTDSLNAALQALQKAISANAPMPTVISTARSSKRGFTGSP